LKEELASIPPSMTTHQYLEEQVWVRTEAKEEQAAKLQESYEKLEAEVRAKSKPSRGLGKKTDPDEQL
jgi:hypothetical protein